MFSGKSTELIRRINRYKVLSKKILLLIIIQQKILKAVFQHSNMKLECISLQNLNDIKKNKEFKKEYDNCEVLVVEEAQFLKILRVVVNAADNDNKIVIVAGLDGDSNKKIW